MTQAQLRDKTYWIEECGKENAFLYRMPVTDEDFNDIWDGKLCVGSMIYPLETWIVNVNTSEVDDYTVAFDIPTRKESLEILWESRHIAI